MGVPVVTLTSDRHTGRGGGLLSQLGLTELIAPTVEDSV